MNSANFTQIERELNIILQREYRDVMQSRAKELRKVTREVVNSNVEVVDAPKAKTKTSSPTISAANLGFEARSPTSWDSGLAVLIDSSPAVTC
jgi:hypothetical protein